MSATHFTLEVLPVIPEPLLRLNELANNLIYSWNRNICGLFIELDPQLWDQVGHNPKVFLRQIDQDKLNQAAANTEFMQRYRAATEWFDGYMQQPPHEKMVAALSPQKDLIAYFCTEFGFHESLPIYSGGLGILAADHCKAASDLGAPFVAIGLLYHKGYFNQLIDAAGNQVSSLTPCQFDRLPVTPLRDSQGKPLQVKINIAAHEVWLNLWQAEVGKVKLYLLDSDTPENDKAFRRITDQLYGGDIHTRIKQEIVLGIGGVRALRALGLAPNIWHINEGHSAFQVLERTAELVQTGLSFDAALEQVRANTVFTTHTPVAAGHDSFDKDMMIEYFGDYSRQLGVGFDRFMALGMNHGQQQRFNMTALALRGSGFRNGVSRIHGGVAAEMESYLWPQVPARENPLGYITNGVELPSYLNSEWTDLFDQRFPQWRDKQLDPDYWQCIEQIETQLYWETHRRIKQRMLKNIRARLREQHRRNGYSMALARASLNYIDDFEQDVLVLGFARRFATYKRATLLFSDPVRLSRLLNNPERPVVIIFAGKAHPQDQPGQALLKKIHEYSQAKDFIGHIILVEGYDVALARSLVAGVDVWLNTPEYPMEACGTSGQKAGINGVINLSVLDGWWGEGFNGKNGWALTPHAEDCDPEYRDRQEGSDLLDILEQLAIPAYFERNEQGHPEQWIALSKESMKTIVPQFNAQRMLMDYTRKMYLPASQQHQLLSQDGNQSAIDLVNWKAQVHELWQGVGATLEGSPAGQISFHDTFKLALRVFPNGLSQDDLVVECLIGDFPCGGDPKAFAADRIMPLTSPQQSENGSLLYHLEFQPQASGLRQYRLRVYPTHALLSHPLDMGLMLWL